MQKDDNVKSRERALELLSVAGQSVTHQSKRRGKGSFKRGERRVQSRGVPEERNGDRQRKRELKNENQNTSSRDGVLSSKDRFGVFLLSR